MASSTVFEMLLSQPSTKTLSTNLQPEVELLLCCAQPQPGPDPTARIKTLLQGTLDWSYLLQLVARRGLMPLLYWNLKAIGPEAVPQAILAQLQGDFQANARRNLLRTRELLQILALFTAHQVPMIPYKGPVLAALLYGNLSLREFSDLDILIPAQYLSKAKELLLSQGYHPWTDPEHPASPRSYNLQFVRGEAGTELLELHWRVTPPYFAYGVELEAFWERLQPLSLAGVTVQGFSPEDLLLILCVHGGKDDWRRLKWVCDVAGLLRLQPDLDWDQVLRLAGSSGCERMLYLGLFLARDLLGVVLPPAVSAKMQADPTAKRLARQMVERLFSVTVQPLLGIEKHLYYVRLREKWQDKLAYLRYQLHAKVAPNANDEALFALPPALYFLYYPLRPVRLVKQYGQTVLKELYKF